MPQEEPTLTPLTPESIQELAWGLSLFFSYDQQEQKYGVDLKNKWDDLVQRYKSDNKVINYLDNVNAVMSGAIYNLAQLRQQVKDHFEFLDTLKKRQIKNLDDLASLSKDAESIATRMAGISIGGALSFFGLANDVLGQNGLFAFLMGVGSSYFVLQFILRKYRNDKIPEVMEKIQQDKKEFLDNEFKENSKIILEELLKKTSAIAEKIYGETHKMSSDTISKLSLNSATITSGSFLTGGTNSPFQISTHSYFPLEHDHMKNIHTPPQKKDF